MDKCEIIERLKKIAEHAVYTVGEEPFVMSLDDGIAVHEAVELLKKSETNCSEIPNNSDAISRQQAVDFVGSMNMCDEISNEACKKLTSYLDELPSIQSERKTGHWVKSDMQRWYDVWLCSECGEKTDSAVMSKPRYKYCPMCGAKMERGEQE